ncbi:Uncharacterised protein [Salmonella enterica subsp. enterica]|uniref:Uncharacterized protein n=1 Tax=Salmonella enterica I TaxID=59201 RepID=A0A379WPN7_SALET|nr:Uncharacterised protein [Salmonella enterica subsp. enterica]
MYRLRLLFVIIDKQPALRIQKLNAQAAAFQQFPGRGRQSCISGQMDFRSFAERMIRSEPRFG